jgi:CheY-like chemotaxis protein/KaiC/GvpD/RAD55 family RecA-like ATPase
VVSQKIVRLLADALGGFDAGLPVVLAGPVGSGRTVISLQAAAEAITRGEQVAYLTQEPPTLLLRQCNSLGFDLESAVRDGHLAFLELRSDVASLVRMHGASAFMAAICEEMPRARLIVIDPVTALASELADDAQLRSLIHEVFDSASRRGQSVVVTVPKEDLRRELEQVLVSLCGGYVELERDASGQRRLLLRTSRSGGLGTDSVPFEIGPLGALVRDEAGGLPDDAAPLELEPAPVAPSVNCDTGLDSGEPEAPSSRRKVLVVDDDRLLRERLTEYLEPSYDVVTAEDGFEAVAAILRERPDLIVLDLMMPRVSGHEVLRTLQAAGADVPVLVVSSFILRAVDRARALILGAADTLSKPVQRFELLHKVESLLLMPRSAQLARGDSELAESLFIPTDSRLLEEESFLDRFERACRFGESIGTESSLLAVKATSTANLEAFLSIGEDVLRIEDAVLRVSPTRALALLVASEISSLPSVLRRLGRGLRAQGRSTDLYRWKGHRAQPIAGEVDWSGFFKDLEPWPDGGSE